MISDEERKLTCRAWASIESITSEKWDAIYALNPEGAEIRKLFEVAKSAIIYGYLCYPLMTLGAEQLHPISERAAKVRARELG